jgi:glycine/D-amino acid oxidase-like deaminating enzyme
VPPGDQRFNAGILPAWIDFNDLVYGIPNVDNRGFKLAIDAHGAEFDPDTGERVVSAQGVAAVRSALGKRFPAMGNAPVLESRVCQYENTSNGDFLIDAHPEMSNVWLVGGGSGHGFKHGPVVGEYVVRMLSGEGPQEPRFSLASKGKVQERRVY